MSDKSQGQKLVTPILDGITYPDCTEEEFLALIYRLQPNNWSKITHG